MGWRIPREEQDESSQLWRDKNKLPPVCGLSDTYWPDNDLYKAMQGRRSFWWWRRRRAYAACRWMIVRREVQVGFRESSFLEVVMR